MPTLDCTTHRDGGVTLVACRLSNGRDEPCRVRLDPGSDAVAPPRTNGLPAPGWTDGRYRTVVAANAVVGVGFATPDAPPDPPATLTVLEAGVDPTDDPAPEPTATGAARSLLDPRPPRAAVPLSTPASHPPGPDDATGATSGDSVGDGDGAVPTAVADWLARVERRGDRSALRAVADRIAAARRRIDAEEP